MTGAQLIPLWILVGVILLFVAVILTGLRFRKRSFQDALQIRAQDIWASVRDERWNFADLLYGIVQDFSATELGLIVRNSSDQEVGRISFHTGSRKGWITIQAAGQIFEADSLNTLRQTVALHPAGDPSQTICTFRRVRRGLFQVEVNGIGIIESKSPPGLRLAPTYEFRLDARPIGASQHIGGWQDRGTWLVLPASIPLPARMFIVAMERLRA